MRLNLKISNVLQNAALRSRPPVLASRTPLTLYSKLSHCSIREASTFACPSLVTRRRMYYHKNGYQRAMTSSQSTSFPDPSRPDLFYHLVDPPTPASSSQPTFALSFLSSPPPSSASRTIIGWLPATSSGDTSGERGAGLNDFKENPKFRDILHKAIQEALQEGLDEIQSNGALQLQNGWMHIHDERNVPALHRIGDPDDILASVLVQDSKIMADTYQAMPSYRFCTSDGIIQLTPGLAQKLQAVLEATCRTESGTPP